MPRDSAVLHTHSDQPPVIVPCALSLKRLASDERAVPFHEPRAVHLERGLMSVEILPRQEVPFLESKRVPRAEADRPDPEVLARLQDGRPHPEALGRGRKELEPRLARVPRARRKEGGPSIGNGGLPSTRDGGVHGPGPPPPLDFRW